MAVNDLDDLFRQQLDGHATPPGPGLQQRLAELAEAERLDTLFRTGLGAHASQPRRAVWERLEDEHLHPQPRRRRVVAWWQYSAAAVLLLLLLAGGAGLWRGQLRQPAGPVATATTNPQPAAPATAAQPSAPGRQALPSIISEAQIIDSKIIANNTTSTSKKNQENIFSQATAPALSPSSPPIATTTRPRRPAPAPQVASSSRPKTRRPDAAAGQLATTGGRKAPAGQPLTTSQETPATIGAPAPRENATLAVAAFTAATAPAGVIEVDVRRGPETARPAAAPAPTVVAEAAPRRRPRLRLGGLLRQADQLVRGESVSLAEATGLPETLTVHARFGGRTLSKTIAL
ncbi:hypothetical protein QMK33_15965 [Hymenobacter sp. H14-R3]|uniref:hypothetical protein n=1 Tax=Hymenobacter sp. H14-R3 TaxID=3046308 RepID=UPI0024B8C812|nr:hypothetical protein [Hymenobacter sp. H14-R3]MDJ0366654.1 hypothetical protein [Hymenobacter sp. H14-R3]